MNWIPAVLWAGVIFLFSTEWFSAPNTSRFLGPLLSVIFSGLTAEQINSIHLFIRKLSHWSEYFILALLITRALRGQFKNKAEMHRAVWTLLAVFLYALSDEFHQAFVPSRTASFADVTIDSFGGICGIFWTYLRRQGK